MASISESKNTPIDDRNKIPPIGVLVGTSDVAGLKERPQDGQFKLPK